MQIRKGIISRFTRADINFMVVKYVIVFSTKGTLPSRPGVTKGCLRRKSKVCQRRYKQHGKNDIFCFCNRINLAEFHMFKATILVIS